MTPTKTAINESVGAQVSAAIARNRATKLEASKVLNLSYSSLLRRCSGEIAFRSDELLTVAKWLGVPVSDLAPKTVKTGRAH